MKDINNDPATVKPDLIAQLTAAAEQIATKLNHETPVTAGCEITVNAKGYIATPWFKIFHGDVLNRGKCRWTHESGATLPEVIASMEKTLANTEAAKKAELENLRARALWHGMALVACGKVGE